MWISDTEQAVTVRGKRLVIDHFEKCINCPTGEASSTELLLYHFYLVNEGFIEGWGEDLPSENTPDPDDLPF